MYFYCLFWCLKFWTLIGWSTLLNKISLCLKRQFFGLNSFQINFKITLWALWHIFMDGSQLSQGYRAISRRQFTFYHSVPRISWYTFNQPRKHERLSQPWSHLVVFNLGHQDWESRPLFPVQPLSEILSISNAQHAESRIWACAESEFRLCWMKLCSSDNLGYLLIFKWGIVFRENFMIPKQWRIFKGDPLCLLWYKWIWKWVVCVG